jgi:hypothetical protein
MARKKSKSNVKIQIKNHKKKSKNKAFFRKNKQLFNILIGLLLSLFIIFLIFTLKNIINNNIDQNLDEYSITKKDLKEISNKTISMNQEKYETGLFYNCLYDNKKIIKTDLELNFDDFNKEFVTKLNITTLYKTKEELFYEMYNTSSCISNFALFQTKDLKIIFEAKTENQLLNRKVLLDKNTINLIKSNSLEYDKFIKLIERT